jgi:hypothetical protein
VIRALFGGLLDCCLGCAGIIVVANGGLFGGLLEVLLLFVQVLPRINGGLSRCCPADIGVACC